MLRIVLVYDISDDKERKKISETCLDYGLDRQQYSVFTGLLKPTHLRQLSKVLASLTKTGSVMLIPVAADEWERRICLGGGDHD
jgi:CRISPR-associated protein Cas2